MECLNIFCIYQKNDKCLLDAVSVDSTGSCQECIYLNIPSEILENSKEKVRQRLDREDGVY